MKLFFSFKIIFIIYFISDIHRYHSFLLACLREKKPIFKIENETCGLGGNVTRNIQIIMLAIVFPFCFLLFRLLILKQWRVQWKKRKLKYHWCIVCISSVSNWQIDQKNGYRCGDTTLLYVWNWCVYLFLLNEFWRSMTMNKRRNGIIGVNGLFVRFYFFL